jgi:hypothetical protein
MNRSKLYTLVFPQPQSNCFPLFGIQIPAMIPGEQEIKAETGKYV